MKLECRLAMSILHVIKLSHNIKNIKLRAFLPASATAVCLANAIQQKEKAARGTNCNTGFATEFLHDKKQSSFSISPSELKTDIVPLLLVNISVTQH